MQLSQFKFYSSADKGSPNLTGQSGSLITLLDKCLVSGYGTGSLYKAPVGWLKPIPNETSPQHLGCWQQPSGSKMFLFMNDASPYSSSTAFTREAWVCGYETILGLTSSFSERQLGTGYGQFPYNLRQTGMSTNSPSSGYSGSVIWRKSSTLDATARAWYMYADAYTMYLMVWRGDTANPQYTMYMFGDIYSITPWPDPYKCMIIGRFNNSTGDSYSVDCSDYMFSMFYPTYGHFIARSMGGGYRSTVINKVTDFTRGVYPGNDIMLMVGRGIAPTRDRQKTWISPIWMNEPNVGIRGFLRGIWWPCHTLASFSDGQNIRGNPDEPDLANKVFRIMSPGPNNGHWAIETTNTVWTNEEIS